MRRVLALSFVLVISVAAASCGTAKQAPPATAVVIDTADTNQYMLPLSRQETQPLRDALAALERGDIAGLTSFLSDSVVMVMPAGNELKGKQAVADYWSNRFKTVLKSLKYSNIAGIGFNLYRTRVNAALGKYYAVWYTVDATYSNGKSITFPAHIAVHTDASGKFDRWMSYYDTKGIAKITGE